MNSKTILFIFFLFNISFSQTKKIQIINSVNDQPISSAIIFHKKDKKHKSISDLNGYFKAEKIDEIIIIKEGFYDKKIQLTENINTISLNPIKTIELKEIVIEKEDINDILDNVINVISNPNIHKHKPNFQYFNYFGTDVDTLLFLNEILLSKPYLGRFISSNSKVIKKFTNKNFIHKTLGNTHITKYRFKNNDIVFFKNFTFRAMSINGINEFKDILENRKKYLYDIEKDENYYKISFKPKSKDANYEGYFILDNYDYGVFEIKIFSSKYLNFTTTDYSIPKPKKFNYKLIKDIIEFKSSKNNNEYTLEKLHYSTEFILTNTGLKNTKFHSKIIIEPTEIFTLENEKKFDILNF